jgi:hypothetical protein
VNGVTFNGLAFTGSNNVTSGNFNFTIPTTFQSSNGFTTASAPFSNLSASYRALLSSGAGEFTNPITLTISNLTVGATYEFEWWSNASSVAGNSQTIATAGNSVALGFNTSLTTGGVGQFAIGTFVANATTQTITFNSTSSSIFNGAQLRQTVTASVPDTGSTLALLSLSTAALGLVARRASRRVTGR